MSEEGEVSSGGSEVSEGEEQQDDADVEFFEFKRKESSRGGELIACQGYEYTFEAKSKIVPGYQLCFTHFVLISIVRD